MVWWTKRRHRTTAGSRKRRSIPLNWFCFVVFCRCVCVCVSVLELLSSSQRAAAASCHKLMKHYQRMRWNVRHDWDERVHITFGISSQINCELWINRNCALGTGQLDFFALHFGAIETKFVCKKRNTQKSQFDINEFRNERQFRPIETNNSIDFQCVHETRNHH